MSRPVAARAPHNHAISASIHHFLVHLRSGSGRRQSRRQKESNSIMYTLGALLLAAILLGAVVSVLDSVLRLVGLHGVIAKIPVIGAHWGLIISILMVWLTDVNLAGNWGLGFSDDWMVWVANGAIIYGMIPVKDAAVSMINKGFRM
jgi:hypothetical protein